jgi:hypothetical protein
MDEHAPSEGDEVEPADIPTDPQIQPGERTGRTGESGAPEIPGGSSVPSNGKGDSGR